MSFFKINMEFLSSFVPSQNMLCLDLSHASYLRKGFGPELELHGTLASLSVDRISGELYIADSPDPARLYETHADPGDTNRFSEFVFPAFESYFDPGSKVHPDLQDGYRVQVFTDAANASARRGTWVEVAEFNQQESSR